MPDAIFVHPRLAAIYDALEGDRADLEVYAAILEELSARRVLDVGCGTGTFALLLPGRGLDVTGVDPAESSLAVARAKPGSNRVRWIRGDATASPALGFDAVTMTGNVAQAIVEPADWQAMLARLREVLQPGGISSSRRASRATAPGTSGSASARTASSTPARSAPSRPGSS